jgi:hypothetical protein
MALLAAVLFIVPVAAASAQRGPGPGHDGPRYDGATEITITGTVTAIAHPVDGRGRKGTHLTVEAEEKSWNVHLGPASYVESKGFTFAAGDQVGVLGSRVEIEGKPVLIARRVTKGDATLELRDEQGRPLWAGRRP